MYCQKCGKELQDSEIYCSKCGTRVGNSEKKTNKSCDFIFKEKIWVMDNIVKSVDRLGNIKLTYFAAILMQIICIFIIGKEMFEISYKVLFLTNSINLTLFENNKGLTILFVLGYVVAAAVMLLPLLLNMEWKRSFFAPALCMPVASLGWFLVVVIQAVQMKDYSGYGDIIDAANVSVKLTGNGVFFLIIMVGELIITYYNSSHLVKKTEVQTLNPCDAKVVEITTLDSDVGKNNFDVCLTVLLQDGQKMKLHDTSEKQIHLGDEGILVWNGGEGICFEKKRIDEAEKNARFR